MNAVARTTPGPRVVEGYAGKKVLVTGGAGFVGSSVSTALVAAGAEVAIFDDLFTGRRELMPEGIERFIEASVVDEEAVREAVAGQDYVIHLAARNITISMTKPTEDFATNIGGTLKVMMACRDLDDPPVVVYTSSSSVYGNPRSLPITEDDPVSILTPYAASKLGGESYCNAFFEMYQLPVVTVRYSNVYGPHQSPENPYCGVVAKFFEACGEGRPMKIHGNGLQTRDYTYVDDAVEATLLAGISPRAQGEIINLGSGFETSVRDLAHLIAKTAGVSQEVEFVDRRDIDNVQRRVLNIERARRLLRWTPQVPLEDGLVRTQEWLAAGSPDR